MTEYSFRKDEILRSKKLTGRLFKEGSSFLIFPFRVFWLLTPLESPYRAQAMFSVGKRSFRHAVDRNLVRRRTREAYRLNKHFFYRLLDEKQQQCVLAFVYVANAPITAEETEKKIIAIFTRLNYELNKTINPKSTNV